MCFRGAKNESTMMGGRRAKKFYRSGSIFLALPCWPSESAVLPLAPARARDFRDFCFVRQMKLEDRKGKGEFPRHLCEHRTAHDIQPMNHKPGHLWMWDQQAYQPVCKVGAVKGMHETKAIVLYWQEGTAKWSTSMGGV